MSTGSMETGPWRETGTMWQVRLRGWQPLCYVAILDIGVNASQKTFITMVLPGETYTICNWRVAMATITEMVAIGGCSCHDGKTTTVVIES